MRREAPVYYDEVADVWGIARYDDVLAIEKDPKTFSSQRAPRPHGDPLPMMISMDDPEHQRRRSLVNRGFTPRRIGEHGADRRRVCAGASSTGSARRGRATSCGTSPRRCRCCSSPTCSASSEEHYDDLLRWSDDLIRATTLDPPPEVADAGLKAMLGFRELQLGVIADRRAEPRDDLISILCAAEIDGDRLDDESIVQETLLILIGGDETTRHVITRRHARPARAPRPAGGTASTTSTSCPSRVEELLRWVSPIKNMARTVTTRRRAAGPAAPRGRPGHALLPVGQPRRGGVRPGRRARRDAGTRTRTWRSGSAPTSASVRRSPAWS